MEDKTKREELISFFQDNNYDEGVIKQVKDDLEAGLSIEQVSIYKIRRLKPKEREIISRGFRLGIPYEIISDMVDHRYKEAQLSSVVSEYAGGTDISVIKDALAEFKTGHDIRETFTQVKERMANTEEKPIEMEPFPDNEITEVSDLIPDTAKNDENHNTSGISGEDLLKSVEMMMNTFTSTMKMQLEHLEKDREGQIQSSYNATSEEIFNKKISELESSLSIAKKELSESYSLMENKDKQLRVLRSEFSDREKELKDSMAEKDKMIKDLREEMDKMSSVGTVTTPVSDGNSIRASDNSRRDSSLDNYVTTIVTGDGKTIPIQVERMERKSKTGLSALMSKFLPKGPAKTMLSRMIEGRYSKEQLAEIMYAYQKNLAEEEVQELLDANLPSDEMHGIIDVVAAAKGGDE